MLNKDKETRSLPIVRLDSVNNDDDDDEENDEENDNSELKLVNDADNDEKYNRYFDSIDINEERKRILNDTMYTSRSSTTVPVFGIEDDGGDEDYIGKWYTFIKLYFSNPDIPKIKLNVKNFFDD